MPYIHGRHDGRSAITPVSIIDAARYREHKQSKKPILKGLTPYRALIDTGASCTMIAARLATELNLEPVGSEEVCGLGGTEWVITYLFHVGFLDSTYKSSLHSNDGDQHSLEHEAAEVNKYHIYTQPITGGELRHETSFDVLLGMDIISTGQLRFEKDGTFSFSF